MFFFFSNNEYVLKGLTIVDFNHIHTDTSFKLSTTQTPLLKLFIYKNIIREKAKVEYEEIPKDTTFSMNTMLLN